MGWADVGAVLFGCSVEVVAGGTCVDDGGVVGMAACGGGYSVI